MECAHCGAPVRQDDTRCEACQRPRVGQTRNAPAGSDVPPPDDEGARPWNAAVWGVVFTAVAVAALLAVLAF